LIRIAGNLAGRIRGEAEAAWPEECCGLLVGRDGRDGGGGVTVSRLVPSPNVADGEARRSKEDRFEIEPKVRFDLMRQLTGSGERIVGHYHSHPGRPARPSGHDVEMAFEPELVWLIVGIEGGRAGEITAWRLNRESRAVQAVKLVIDRS
jgi:proteasome lid subunit RPN8/RPN11